MIRQFIAALFLVFATTQVATADHLAEGDFFYGDWNVGYERQGDIDLGDGGGYFLDLRSTTRYCGRPGASYSKMNRYIRSNYPDPVRWYVDEVCDDGYVRICVYSAGGNVACSTYADYGWK
ncbi:MAG: hypothetical protein ACK4SL_03445 [Candidatus Paceibacteria bacterium]